jgi:hypothetical protein
MFRSLGPRPEVVGQGRCPDASGREEWFWLAFEIAPGAQFQLMAFCPPRNLAGVAQVVRRRDRPPDDPSNVLFRALACSNGPPVGQLVVGIATTWKLFGPGELRFHLNLWGLRNMRLTVPRLSGREAGLAAHAFLNNALGAPRGVCSRLDLIKYELPE